MLFRDLAFQLIKMVKSILYSAWHVVSSYSPAEEIDIYTSDDLPHLVLAGSVRRLGDIGLAVMSFRSNSNYF